MKAKSRMIRWFLFILGSASTVLGLLGLLIPILPTTPFLLLASACFVRSSDRLHRWMLTNRFFGRYLSDYQSGKGLPVTLKAFTLLLLWFTIISSVIVIPQTMLWLRVLLICIAVIVSIHIISIRSKHI